MIIDLNRSIISICIALVLMQLSSCMPDKPKTSNVTDKYQLRHINHTDAALKTIHVFVALCDNKYQGIVPVPPKIGNGQDPEHNLYWGSGFGIRTYFKKSEDWNLLEVKKMRGLIMERLVFKHALKNYYLIADAYDGQYIKQTTIDFLNSCAGSLKDTLHIKNTTIGINGNAALLAYIGHDGLMDFKLPEPFNNTDGKCRDCIILACLSKKYFNEYIKNARTYPLVWTNGLMCPEAYTLHDAISGYVLNKSHEQVRSNAASAYNQYQKCGLTFANSLLIQGL